MEKASLLREFVRWASRVSICVFLASAVFSHILEEQRKTNPRNPDRELGYVIPEEMKGGTVYISEGQFQFSNIVGWLRLISFSSSVVFLLITWRFFPEDAGKF